MLKQKEIWNFDSKLKQGRVRIQELGLTMFVKNYLVLYDILGLAISLGKI